MKDTWTIELDADACSGFGDCAAFAPGLLELGADGTVRVLQATTDEPAALDAVMACPMAALIARRASTGEQVA